MADPSFSPAETMLRVPDAGASAEGRRLGLTGGDILVAINGKTFRGWDETLEKRFDTRGDKPLALTFRRGEVEVTVLAETHRLARWDHIAAPVEIDPEEENGRRIDPAHLRNWEVMRSAATQLYDLHPSVPPLTALIAPPIWVLQMRLWVPFATLLAALIPAALVSPFAAAVVWFAAGLYVRRSAAFFVRADRRGRGLSFAGMIAARTEAEAHAKHLLLHPEDRNLFARSPAQPAQQNA